MKIEKSIRIILVSFLLVYSAACAKRNFYPDPDDPGLSRLTAYGFNIATAYINGVPYINPFDVIHGNTPPLLRNINTTSTFDTLCLSWETVINDSTQTFNSNYTGISLLIPVSKTFNEDDLLALSGQRLDSNTSAIQLIPFYNPGLFTGTANIYFVKISAISNDSIRNYIISGLFNGNIGNNQVTDGRFDFEISSEDLNF